MPRHGLTRPFGIHELCYDVLQLVFEHLLSFPDDHWLVLGRGNFNPTRARLPFALSAICRHWRHLALRMPSLWTYLGVPCPTHSLVADWRPHLARVELVLARSGSAPLDVFLRWRRFEGMCDVQTWSAAEIVFARMVGARARWRRAELHLRHHLPLSAFAPLDGLAQELVELCLDADKGCLPHAPKLAHLVVRNAACVWAFPGEENALPELRALEVHGERSEVLRKWLRKFGNRLEELAVAPRDDPWHLIQHALSTESSWLDLPNLVSLTQHFGMLLTPTNASNLTSLGLCAQYISDNIIDSCGLRHRDTVTRLHIFGPAGAEDVEILRVLPRVTRLAFTLTGEWAMRTKRRPGSGELVCGFLRAIAEGPNVWPELAEVAFVEWEESGGAHDLTTMAYHDEVVELLRARNTPRSKSKGASGDPTPARIDKIQLNLRSATPELIAVVDRLLVG